MDLCWYYCWGTYVFWYLTEFFNYYMTIHCPLKPRFDLGNYIPGVTRTKFGHGFTHQNKTKVSISTCVRKYLTCELQRKEYIRNKCSNCSSKIFGACLNTSHDGLPHPFRDDRTVMDSLTGIHSALKCLFIVNRTCAHNGYLAVPWAKNPENWSQESVVAMQCVSPPPPPNSYHREHLALHGWTVPDHHHACTTFVLWPPVVHLTAAMADHVEGNLGSGCL
jgi:hypothetical protein